MAVVTSCWIVLEEVGYSHKCVGSGKMVRGLNTCSASMGSGPSSHILKMCSVAHIVNSSAGQADPRGLLASQSSEPVS